MPPRTPSSATDAPSVRWFALAILVAGLLAYANSLHAPFVLDDDDAIVRNPHITSLTPLSAAMAAPPQSSFAGRPVAAFSLAVSYAMGGLSPAAFRVWNIAVLIASATVLFGIVRRTMRRVGGSEDPPLRGRPGGADVAPLREALLALAVAMWWLLHPLNSEVVGYVTQRTESMMGLCYLLTLYGAIRAIDEPARAWVWSAVAVAACAAGMACKESMVTAPVMVLLYDVVFGAGSAREALGRRRGLYAGLAASWLVLAWLNLDSPRSGSAGFATAVSPVDYLLNQGEMIVTYLKLAVWPAPLILDYGRTQPVAFATAWPFVAVVAALMAAVAFAWLRHHRVLAFLGTWFFVTLAPTSSVIPIATEVGAERRMYLPLMALAVLVVLGLRAAARRWSGDSARQTRTVAGLTAVFTLALGGMTMARNLDYRDPIGIWRGVIAERPHGRAHYNLGIALTAAGRGTEALYHYRAALPGEPAAHYALGFDALGAGRFAEAESELQAFLRLRPADSVAPQAGLLLSEALIGLNRPADAERALRDTLDMAPGFGDALGKLADLLLAQARYAEAIPIYRDYLARHPDTAPARHSLGLALAITGQEPLAVAEFEQAVALSPADAQFRMSLGTALASTGRLVQAIPQYREALRLAPADARIMSALALALADAGARDESLNLFRRALQLAPDDPTIQADFQSALALIQQRP